MKSSTYEPGLIFLKKGIDVVCRYHENHYEQKLPFLTSYLRDAMGTKMAVTFSVIFIGHAF